MPESETSRFSVFERARLLASGALMLGGVALSYHAVYESCAESSGGLYQDPSALQLGAGAVLAFGGPLLLVPGSSRKDIEQGASATIDA